MTVFISRVVTTDPKPWQYRGGFRQAWGPGHDSVKGWSAFAPRPEFTQVSTTPVNPLLANFRRILHDPQVPVHLRWSTQELAAAWATPGYLTYDGNTAEEIAHARRVFERLAKLEPVPN